jgi:hypothetical protein
MDWRHHPAKTQEWYTKRKNKFTADGLEHIFAREVDRDYAAALQGVIVPKKWLDACVDAHLKIGDPEEWESGKWIAGQDVADGGHDTNALVKRKGWVVKYAEQWGERDTGSTTRRMVNACLDTLPITIYYDSVGVGSGVKAEANRLTDENLMPRGINLVPWSAGAAVQYPGHRVIEDDKGSPRNKDFFANLKAQGWWSLRNRVYRTFKAVTVGEMSPIDEMISFDSKAIGNLLYKLIEEIAQPTAKPNTRMKLEVDKMPEGASSPNLGDACMECCFPLRDRAMDDLSALVTPRLVNGGNSCLNCGSKTVVVLGQGRYQCRSCGHKGDWDTRLSTDDVRDRNHHYPLLRPGGR